MANSKTASANRANCVHASRRKWGHDGKGRQRFLCKQCGLRFTEGVRRLPVLACGKNVLKQSLLLPCVHSGSDKAPAGFDAHGKRRWKCKICGRTSILKSRPPFSGILPDEKERAIANMLEMEISTNRIASIVGVNRRTVMIRKGGEVYHDAKQRCRGCRMRRGKKRDRFCRNLCSKCYAQFWKCGQDWELFRLYQLSLKLKKEIANVK